MEIREEDRAMLRNMAADLKAIREVLERQEERDKSRPDHRQQSFDGMPPLRS